MFVSHSSARPSSGRGLRPIICAALLGVVASLVLATASAATPSKGTISVDQPTLRYSAGPFAVSNNTGAAGDVMCGTATPCDDFQLTLAVPKGYEAKHSITVSVTWPNSAADFDLYVLDASGAIVRQAASASDPETAIIPALAGSYTLRVVPFLPLGQSFSATAGLTNNPAPPPPPKGTPPKYQNFAAPSSLNSANSAGEPSIGVDWKTGAAMFQSYIATYRVLFNDFVSASAAAATPDSTDASDQVFVTGMVDGENPRGEITQLLILPGNTLPPAARQVQMVNAASVDHDEKPPTIAYTLRFLDANNKPIDINGNEAGTDRKLALEPLDDHTNESSAQLFKALFPKPAQQAVAILLLANGNEIDRIAAGTHVPTVTVQKPAAGTVVDNQMTIQWTAHDDDPNDRLKFTVQYSHDNGASWQVVGMDIPSTPTATTTLDITDLGSLQGSAPNAAKIRVLASDGYNTAIAESANFTVKNRPPLVSITAPNANQTVPGGQSVLLQGMATDPEDGGLSGNSLKWQVDGVDYGTGEAVSAAGLGSFTHTAALQATDSNSQTATATVNFKIAPLSIPLGAEPTLDGECSDSSYTSAINLPLSPYGNSTQANVRIMRSDNYMWLCFTDLISNSVDSGDYVGVRVDVDNSRDPLAKASDLGFFVAKDGSVIARQGDGNGNFVDTDASAVAGQILLGSSTWSAEVRIDKAAFNDWGHLISMAVGHHSVSGPGDDYVWPFQSQLAKPNTWSDAALGIQPVIDVITPNSASVNSSTASAAAVNAGSTFTLTVEGSDFVSGTQVLWNGQLLPTKVVTDGVLLAQVPIDKLDKAGVANVTTRSPAPDSFVSIGLPFIVEAAKPVITSLLPGNVVAESTGFVLTIQGSNFVTDSKVLWNDTELTPKSVNAHQIMVQIDSSLLINGRVVGVAVANPTPNAQISAIVPFEINARNQMFVPGLFNQK